MINLYSGEKKPKFRNLYAIGALCMPFYLLLIPFILIGMILVWTFYLTMGFFTKCLFKEEFITDSVDKFSGYFSLALSIIGLITLIRWIF